MDIERELETLINKHKGKQVGLGEIRTETTSEPCDWCCGGDRFECYLIDDEGHTISIENNIVQTVIANYCPNCGRRLED